MKFFFLGFAIGSAVQLSLGINTKFNAIALMVSIAVFAALPSRRS